MTEESELEKRGEEINSLPGLVKMENISFDAKLFEPIKTGKLIDTLLSSAGGFPRSTNFMLVGDPGIGKSTVAMDIVSDLQIAGASVLFISAEMDRVDLYGYVKRYPKFGKIEILFLGEYLDHNPKEVVEKILKKGYDIVLIDSFIEVRDTVKEGSDMSSTSGDKWLIDLMRKHNSGDNDSHTHTSFLVIQQVTKNGDFVGSNRLKHALSGMAEMRFHKDGSRYIAFVKNRRGDINKKVFFDLSSTGDVKYDMDRYNMDESVRKILNH